MKSILQYNKDRQTAQVSVEKRALSRIPTDKPVLVVLANGSLAPARLLNMSGSGALLEVRANFELKDVIELKLMPSDLPFAKAQVTRIAKAYLQYGIQWLEFYEDQLPKGLLFRGKT